ncbi:hypothetical protein ISCGN_019715 [Ixodes scapularis]
MTQHGAKTARPEYGITYIYSWRRNRPIARCSLFSTEPDVNPTQRPDSFTSLSSFERRGAADQALGSRKRTRCPVERRHSVRPAICQPSAAASETQTNHSRCRFPPVCL